MRMLTENLRWKLLSLLLAVILWATFVGETEIATSIPILVQYRNLPPDLEVIADHPDRLFMKLRGPSARLTPAALQDTALVLDLGNVALAGEQTFTISEQGLGLPAGVTLLRVVPSQVRLSFAKRAEKNVPVEVRFQGPPPAGYRIVSQQVSPSSVLITGPEARLALIESAQTDAIDLSSTIGNGEFRVPVFLTDPEVRFRGTPPTATVRLTVEKIPQS